ncbi:MAG: ACT domain-containing protein [Leptolyngbyaceae cyanobacterium]
MNPPIGESNLATLLATLQPELQPTVFVFCTIGPEVALPQGLSYVCQFYEQEGTTLILPQAEADRAHLPYHYRCRQITLKVHSSLAAVGLLATVTQALAAEGISGNVVSAYFHDHLFVPSDRATDAVFCLERVALQAISNLDNQTD